ncbi:Membrane protein involved in the export of O-antigen and teichoic acid [Methylobacterium phyllostachyos]|uniref:Membrane protein involved in the export of O-antigen and teichoic acid n=1 Tax=Methylobacterium phyllostachyos TaxID=582672 RepID=A0A1G9R9W6_9HYPH|nr:Membrane protein involved in the export of O-antigen and teichoic acid [Methylobacterium phyllostachyos]
MIQNRNFVALLVVFSRAWGQLCGGALLFVAGRLLTLDEFGAFAVASALSMMFSQWVGVGAYERIISSHNDDRAVQTSFIVSSAGSIALVIITIIISQLARLSFSESNIPTLVLLLAFLGLPSSWRSTGEAILIGGHRLGVLALCSVILDTTALVVSCVLLLLDKGVYSLIIGRYFQFGFGGILLLAASGFRYNQRLVVRDEIATIYKLWRSMIADRILIYFQNYSADLLLGFMLGPASAGIYRISVRMVQLLSSLVSEPLRPLCWKMLSRKFEKKEDLATSSEEIIGAYFMILTGPLCVLAFFGGDVAQIILGPAWSEVGTVVFFLSLASVVTIPVLVSEPILGVTGAISSLPVIRGKIVLLSVGAMVASAYYGPIAVAVSQLVVAIISVIIFQKALYKYAHVRLGAYLSNIEWAAASAVFAVVLGLAINKQSLVVNRYVVCLLETGLSVMAYFLILLLKKNCRSKIFKLAQLAT